MVAAHFFKPAALPCLELPATDEGLILFRLGVVPPIKPSPTPILGVKTRPETKGTA